MEIAKLEGQARQAHGSRAAERLRRQDKIPGVVYGHRQEPQNVAVGARDLENLIEHGSHVIELSIDGSAYSVLIRDVQFDPIGIDPIHVDFMRVDLNERVTVSVPLEFRGTPVGTHAGGLFEEHLVDLEVETQVLQIPDSIRVHIGDLGVGDVLHVRDITLPPDVRAITAAEAIVCNVRAKATAEAVEAVEEEEEAPEQPEIITAKEKDQEASARGEG